MRINGTKRARQSFIAVDFCANERGPADTISSVRGYPVGCVDVSYHAKMTPIFSTDLRIYQNKIVPILIHMFFDISLEKNENIYIL